MGEKYFEKRVGSDLSDIGDDDDQAVDVYTDLFYKIPVTGDEWRERIEDTRSAHEELNNIFGLRVLWKVYYVRHRGPLYEAHKKKFLPSQIKNFAKDYKERIPQSCKDLQNGFVSLAKKYPHEVRWFFVSFLEHAENIDDVCRRLGVAIGSPDDIADACMAKIVSKEGLGWDLDEDNALFIKMIEFHVQETEKRTKTFTQEAVVYKEKVLAKLTSMIEFGRLPLEKEVLEERVRTLDVYIIDYLVASLGEKWGDYVSKVHIARIASSVPMTEVWRVFVHEVLHSVSGVTDVMMVSENFPDITSVQTERLGLRFGQVIKSGRGPEQREKDTIRLSFKWLNEALTESLAMEITGDTHGSYPQERELLRLLIEKFGIDRALLEAAYFENYYADKESVHPTPALRRLFEETNKKFGPRFLVDLDLCVRGVTTLRTSDIITMLTIRKIKTCIEAIHHFADEFRWQQQHKDEIGDEDE